MPPERVFHTLDALTHGKELQVDDSGRMVAVYQVRGKQYGWEVEEEELETLSALGWIDLGVDGEVTVTERGKYHLGKWAKGQRRKVRR